MKKHVETLNTEYMHKYILEALHIACWLKKEFF